LLDLAMFLSRQFEDGSTPVRQVFLDQFEETIVLAFLSLNEHSFSNELREEAASVAPQAVRRAEDYIEAHWDRFVGVEELAKITNVSVRSLFRVFKKTRGYSPNEFARTVRLRHAKRALEAGHPETTITAIALRFGFRNLSHFAISYRAIFGELPSQALGRANRTTCAD
jgi:transcriptional regulator GlxA family with amidase domain